ncbi:MAG: class I SAM-dependent methyltransferase [Candidatus Nanopelagicales bacterium]
MPASQVLERWYALAYRFPSTPWERAARATTASTGALLDREETQRPRPLGRALDLGCGRGFHTAELANRGGWQAVGVDLVPRAIQPANRRGVPGTLFVVGDVTNLAGTDLGTFDFFLDVGCLQGFNDQQRCAVGQGVTKLANPGATADPGLPAHPLRRLHRGADQSRVAGGVPTLGGTLRRPSQPRRTGVAADSHFTALAADAPDRVTSSSLSEDRLGRSGTADRLWREAVLGVRDRPRASSTDDGRS